MEDKEPHSCPLDCPNRNPKQMGKGYSYLFAIALTTFLGFQAIHFKADSDHWEISLSPVPVQIWIPGVTLIASVLGLDTDKLAEALGVLLSGKRDEE